jgi:hypothetical protein
MNGDPTTNVTAYVGCSNGTIRAGYVTDHSDCDDQDPLVNPGQTQYFATKSTGPAHTFDYNCSGALEKGIPEYPGLTCEFCNSTPTCSASGATCTAAGEQAAFTCGPRRICTIIGCKPPLLCIPRCTIGGCYPDEAEPGLAAFNYTVNCGAVGSTTTCGTCGAVGEGPGQGTGAVANVYTSTTQTCH